MPWEWIDSLGGGFAGAIVTLIVMVIRERNSMAARTMEILLAANAKLEKRVDYLTTELDKVKERLYMDKAPE
jgi:hypothetical protein